MQWYTDRIRNNILQKKGSETTDRLMQTLVGLHVNISFKKLILNHKFIIIITNFIRHFKYLNICTFY